MTDLLCENYNKRSVAIRGNKDKYQNAMENIGAKWEPRMKNGPGWILPKENEPDLQRLIESFQKLSKLEELTSNSKSRRQQNKYRREDSESEGDSSSESGEERSDSDSEDIPPIIEKLLERERQIEDRKKVQENSKFRETKRYRDHSRSSMQTNRSEESRKQSRQTNDPIDFYRSFNQKPASFREKQNPPVEKDEEYSSSNDSRSGSSSDNFPSPRTPVKRNTNHRTSDYESLAVKLDAMEKRMKQMERENRYRR